MFHSQSESTIHSIRTLTAHIHRQHFREAGVGEDWLSLPQYFKTFGYLTLGSGKLFHPTNSKENIGFPDNDWPASWSPEYVEGTGPTHVTPRVTCM